MEQAKIEAESFCLRFEFERIRRWLRLGSLILAVGYLVGLVLVILGMRLVGERWWVTTTLLYLPRFGFALPLPVVVLALVLFGPRRLLWSLPLPVALLLFPLMGLHIGPLFSVPAQATARPVVRVLSYNVATADSPDEVAAVVGAAHPDILLMQEYKPRVEQALGPHLSGFHRHSAGQFSIASRYPLGEVHVPPTLNVPNSHLRTPRFVRYQVHTPLGPIQIYNVHPVSPRQGLEVARAPGFLRGLFRGRIGHREGIAILTANSALRQLQVEALAADARRSPDPVLIAGDTNMPGLSRTYARSLGGYTDGFQAAGRGFGYTFPSHRPWMRIDRILTNPPLRFVRFYVIGNSEASDHLAIVAELTRDR